MYKLMIVDDEDLERQVLRMFVEQSNLEIDTIVECANGVDAVKTALLEQPNICILDIRMPGLNGLEAMSQILAVNKSCKVIFSSAYYYFDYAVKAMQMGALDFMTKPVKKETVLKILTKAIDQLDKAQSLQTSSLRMRDMTYVLEKRMLRELVTGETDEETLWFLDTMGFGGDTCGCTLFVRFASSISETDKASFSIALRSELSAAGIRHLLYAHRRSVDLLAFCKDQEQLTLTQTRLQPLVEQALAALNTPYTLALTTWADDLLQIELSYIEAKGMLGEHMEASEPRNSPVLPVSAPVSKAQLPVEIEAICRYIDENYCEKITLDSITESVGFSKFYASRLFKKYTGTTIIDYLIGVRLAKAKELLMSGEYSIKQISYMIGYSDPNYFTWSFKKYIGVSPVKYRYFQNLSR